MSDDRTMKDFYKDIAVKNTAVDIKPKDNKNIESKAPVVKKVKSAKGKKTRLTVMIDPTVKGYFKILANGNGFDMSELVNNFVIKYIRDNKKDFIANLDQL